MGKTAIPLSRLDLVLNSDYHTEMIKTGERLHRQHPATRCPEYHQSRWPYTDRLTSGQMTWMKDTYTGHRKVPTKLVTKCHAYDRVFNMDTGWDQRTKGDTRIHMKDIVINGRDEDNNRIVPIASSKTYGHRNKSFYDFISNANRNHYICDNQFYRRDKISTLPPLVGSVRHPHLPRYNQSM